MKFAASVASEAAATFPVSTTHSGSFIEDNGYAPYLIHGYAFTKIQPAPLAFRSK